MSKATCLNDLNRAYEVELSSKWRKCNGVYKKRGEHRWLEVMEAHNRRFKKKVCRSTRKSKKVRVRNTVLCIVRALSCRDSLAKMCRRRSVLIAG